MPLGVHSSIHLILLTTHALTNPALFDKSLPLRPYFSRDSPQNAIKPAVHHRQPQIPRFPSNKHRRHPKCEQSSQLLPFTIPPHPLVITWKVTDFPFRKCIPQPGRHRLRPPTLRSLHARTALRERQDRHGRPSERHYRRRMSAHLFHPRPALILARPHPMGLDRSSHQRWRPSLFSE